MGRGLGVKGGGGIRRDTRRDFMNLDVGVAWMSSLFTIGGILLLFDIRRPFLQKLHLTLHLCTRKDQNAK